MHWSTELPCSMTVYGLYYQIELMDGIGECDNFNADVITAVTEKTTDLKTAQGDNYVFISLESSEQFVSRLEAFAIYATANIFQADAEAVATELVAKWMSEFSRKSLLVKFMGPTWGPSGADRTQVGPMLAPWTLLSGYTLSIRIISEEEITGWKARISYHIDDCLSNVITHSCPNLNGGLAKPPLKLGLGWVITSHCLCGCTYSCLIARLVVNKKATGPIFNITTLFYQSTKYYC